MTRIKKINLLFVSLVLIINLSVTAQTDLETGTTDVQKITNLIVEPKNSSTGVYTDYSVEFTVSLWEFFKLNQGTVEIDLPDGFGLEHLDSVSFSDDCKYISYQISSIVEDAQELSLSISWEIKWKKMPDESSAEFFFPVNVRLLFFNIKNPDKEDSYALTVSSIDRRGATNFGPLSSEPFTIKNEVSAITTIVVSPGTDFSIQAGESQQFSAEAFDENGDKIEGLTFTWSLDLCTNCIGYMVDSTLHVETTGQGKVQAEAEGVSGYSGTITVTPGNLSRMELQISSSQVVGNSLQQTSGIILYDQFNNLKFDYNLFANPITLVSGQGTIQPNIFSNNSHQVGGVVRLSEYDIFYYGNSGLVPITAEAGTVVSNIKQVYFSNYDVLDVITDADTTLSIVYRGQPPIVTVPVLNSGNLLADHEVTVNVFYASNPTNMVIQSFTPSSPGVTDHRILQLPDVTGLSDTDELVITTSSQFTIGDSVLSATSEYSTPILISDSSIIRFVEDSFLPDTVLNDVPFTMSFSVDADFAAAGIDSSYVRVVLLDPSGMNELSVIFESNGMIGQIADSLISFDQIPGVIGIDDSLPNQLYPVLIEVVCYAGSNILSLETPAFDNIFVILNQGLSLVPNSLIPQTVYAGSNVSFTFKLFLDGEQAYRYHQGSSVFRIYDSQFSTTSNLFLESDSIRPGENIFRSAQISIQPQQVGQDLFASGQIVFSIPGIADPLTYSTDFPDSSLPIEVRQSTSVQILDLEILAPNAPKINITQEFQMLTKIINQSNNLIDSLIVNLVSVQAASTIHEPVKMISGIQPLDTIEVLFNVTADDSPNLLPESFRVDILSESIQEIEPVNNSSFLFIEDPAVIEYSYRVNGLENADGIIVRQGDLINLSLSALNLGTASVSDGIFRLIVEGLDIQGADTLIDTIGAGKFIDYAFTAPLVDTLILFSFELIAEPVDQNIQMPAQLINSDFTFSVSSITSDVELVFEAIPLGSNLVLPGRPKELIDLIITNAGNASLNSIKLQQITFNFYNKDLKEIEARSVIGLNNTGFYNGNTKLTSSTYGGNNLTMWFDDFILNAQESKVITLQIDFTESDIETVQIEALQSEIKAVFNDGPNIGNQVSIASSTGDERIIALRVVLKGGTFEESFIVDNNPFNPEISPVHLAYELEKDSPVEFRVFTLTGELVYSRHYDSGESGAVSGENMIEWDGRNSSGGMVVNGVYIATIENVLTGETAHVKIALVK